jgi:hypothetical protein
MIFAGPWFDLSRLGLGLITIRPDGRTLVVLVATVVD